MDSFFSGILDSFFSGILDSNVQYSGFHDQKFPGFRNLDYLTLGDLVSTLIAPEWSTNFKRRAWKVSKIVSLSTNAEKEAYCDIIYE